MTEQAGSPEPDLVPEPGDGRATDAGGTALATPVAEADEPRGGQTDAELDAGIDALDDGTGLVGAGFASSPDAGGPPEPGSAQDPLFAVPAREHFVALGDVEPTGDARVDAATARLAEVVELPTSEHVAVYDDVHRRLQDALADAELR